jgi:alpha-tubulin suppressor-like RCC1 family protein
MTIDTAGVIRWVPAENQAPSTNSITTVVTDDGTPPMSATNAFTVVVLAGTGGPQVPLLAGPIVNPANEHRYFLLDQASWTNAENAAIALGGHLVTINNTEENTWVYNTFGGYGGIGRDLWIGLFDSDPVVNYFNMDLEAAKYRWISGEPAPVDLWQWGGIWRPTGSGYISLGHVKLAGPQNVNDWDRAHWLEEYASTEVCSVVELPLNLQIVAAPQSASAGIGGEATLTVFAEGSTPLSYQWQCAGTNLPGETRASLIITNAQPSMSGFYSVVVSNASGILVTAPVRFSVGGIVPWGTYPHNDPRTVVPDGLSTVKAIAAGWYHDLALKPDGTVVAWGDNSHNQLDLPPDLTDVVAIAGGQYHSLALKSNGSVVVWGSMVQPPAVVTNVTSIDAGSDHCLALRSDGTVVAWGGSYGDAGAILGGLTDAVAISAGEFHDLVLKADGNVVDVGPRASEGPVPPDLTNIVAVSAGQTASLALRANGTVVGWGTGNSDFFFLALDIPPGLTNVVAISAKANHSMALLADGSVVAWGTNFWGESSVPPRLPNTIAIAGGYNHSFALLRDGAPNMTIQPWDRSVSQGANPTFEAKAVGSQSMTYQWQFNGSDIADATLDTLSISNAQPGDAGSYTVTVSNDVSVTTSRRAKLVVGSSTPNTTNPPPVLTSIPMTNGNFRLRVSGALGPNYILQGSGNLSNWVNLQTSSPAAIPVEFVDTNLVLRFNRFYRVRLAP